MNLHDDYEQAGFSGTLGFGEKPAVIVVDWCRAYLDPEASLYADVEDAFQSTIRVVAAARAAGVPILWTRVEYEPGGADGGVFYRKVAALRSFDRGNPMADFDDRLRPQDGDVVITKQYASGFFGTSLAATLTSIKEGAGAEALTDVPPSGCLRPTALDACHHGFIPIDCSEAVGDRDEAVHEANLFDLGAKYADVVSERDVLAWVDPS